MDHRLGSAAAAASSGRLIVNSATKPSTSTLLFQFHPNFNIKTPPLKLSIFSHPSSANHFNKIYYYNSPYRLQLRHFPPIAATDQTYPPPPPPPQKQQRPSKSDANKRKLSIVVCSAVTVALAIANRVLYKLALVPMKEFPFFLAQLTTFGYVAIYFSILFMRYRAGIATDEMLSFPKIPFIIIGLLEALGVVSGMYSGAMLPGPAIPILNQTFLLWQLAFSMLILGRTYSLNRFAGSFLVAAGVVLAVTSGSEHDQLLSGVEFVWPAMMIASSAFQAVASILKESVFLDAATRLKGKLIDIFVVNSFGSGFQGIPLSEFPSYLKSGAACFFNIGANTTGCDGSPTLPLLYIITNIAFNISVLNLLKYSSAVVSSLAVMSSVPISIYILSLPLPYLPEGANLSPFFVLGSAVLMVGLIVYNFSWPVKQDSDIS
ncbi:hypothetical protein ABFS82_14G268300 [Erythranthe guttata]